MSGAIGYNETTQDGRIIVKLEGKTVGHIKPHDGGFLYLPKGISLKRVIADGQTPVSFGLLKTRLEAK
jgi:hypothetical protein